MAVTDISNKIKTGQIEVGLAVGFESMTDKCVFTCMPNVASILTSLLS